MAGGHRVSCDSAARPLPPAAAGPFPERPGGGGRRGATISARARGCRPKAGQDRRAGGSGGARGSRRSGPNELPRRLAGSCGSAPSRARPAMRAAPEPRPPPRRALRWACPGGGRRAPSSAAPGALRTRRSRARWQHVCGVRSPEAAGQGGDHARRHPEGELGEAPERGPRRGGVGRGSGPAVVRAGAGKPAEPFGACSARTKAPATAARFPRGARVLAGAARGREWGGPRESAVAPPRRDPTRGSRSLECCAANSSELRPSRENLGTFRRGSGQARKELVDTGVPQRSTRDPIPSALDRCA